MVWLFVSLISEYQRFSGMYCLHVHGRSAEWVTNLIRYTVRIQGSSKGSSKDTEPRTGRNESCTSPLASIAVET